MPELTWIGLLILFGVFFIVRFGHLPVFGAKKQKTITQDYFKGLNYLLNEQTDKAIEVFMRMLEVEKETVEIHLALGNLFRRRGEVDRSIRIHQNLIQEASLSHEQRSKALLELANDYLCAGLLDRAESLLQELVQHDSQKTTALKHLAYIYEQEKDWHKAIEVVREWEKCAGINKQPVLAHYYCELAEEERRQNPNDKKIESRLQNALTIDPACVRASIMLGHYYLEQEQYQNAIASLNKIAQQAPEFLGEVIDPLKQCYAAMNDMDEFLGYLMSVLPIYSSTRLIITIAELLRQRKSDEQAMVFVTEQLNAKPSMRGLEWLININLEHSDEKEKPVFNNLKEVTAKMLEDQPRYKCTTCGFAGGVLYWNCPGCKNWNSIKPIHVNTAVH